MPALDEPQPPRISVGDQAWVTPEEYKALGKRYTPKITIQLGELARQIGTAHGGTDLLIDWRLIDCLRNGLPL